MPDTAQAYRGQSRSGLGEGPGREVPHGEQYLKVSRELYENQQLLDEIRPWMTLDSVEDRVEGWSLFTAGKYLFIARLVSAGTYDRRAAYFAHARAWSLESLRPGDDPGLYVGRSAAFDEPWQDTPPATPASLDAPAQWPQQARSEPERAARFLGHLFQSILAEQPLIIGAPVTAFAVGGALHGLVCLARAGLPAHLRKKCRIRIYSRRPDLFLQFGANLLAVPEDAASAALGARPSATLLDAEGNRVAGTELDPRALAYAAAVVERAAAIPDGLPHFSERMRVRGDFASAAAIHALQITYNVAFAFAGPAEHRAEMLTKYLPRAAAKLGPGLPWPDLISSEEWRAFPDDALVDLLLADSRKLSEGGREFLALVENEAANRRLTVDRRLKEWWSPDDPIKLGRLLELLAHEPPLVSKDAAPELTADIPIDDLAKVGPVVGVLDAEVKRGWLSRRGHEATALAEQARKHEGVLEILSRAVSQTNFDHGWARTFVRMAGDNELTNAANQWCRDPQFWTNWGNVPKQLLDRLRELTPPQASVLEAAQRGLDLDPVEHFDVHLRAADVVARIEPGPGLLDRLWQALPRFTEARRDFLEAILFDPDWPCLKLGNLDTLTLLALGAQFKKGESYDALYAELDQRMRRDPDMTTRELTRSGWWFFWRSRSRLDHRETLEQSAFGWLTSDAWNDGEAATLEAWKVILTDLPPKISGQRMAQLRGPGVLARRPWPWIPPFEAEQLDALINKAEDLGALAEIADSVHADGSKSPFELPAHDYVLQHSGFANSLAPSALAWLSNDRSEMRTDALPIAHSATLYRYAGEHHRARAVEARIRSLTDALTSAPHEALQAASSAPDLWSDNRFLYNVARWMNDRGSIAAIGERNLKYIDEHSAGDLKTGIRSPSERLVRELGRRYSKAAQLIHPRLVDKIQIETLADEVLDALIRGRDQDPCWEKFAAEVKKPASEEPQHKHPLMALAERIRTDNNLTNLQIERLAKGGWETFEAAARRNAILMSPRICATELPAFHLATSMLGPGSMGAAARQVICAPSNRGRRQDFTWWCCLLRSIYEFRRHGRQRSADDHEGLALAAIRGVIGLPEERRAFLTAVQLEAKNKPDWTLLSEFGAKA